MAETSQLNIVVNVTAQQAQRALKALDKTVEDSGKEAKTASLRWTEFQSKLQAVQQVAQIVGGTFQKAFDLGKEGAQIIQTRESFDTLLRSIGAAPDLLDQLKSSADGTIDEMTLMGSVATLTAGATDEVAQAMAQASPQLLEIARAASKLNPQLGDSSKLFQDIGTGIKRASPLILDNLGLTIKLGPAQERYAESIGKTVEQLTDEEKQLAILNDVQRAGNILIAQAGGTADSAVDDFARLETTIKELSDEMKARLAPSLADAANGLNTLITFTSKINTALDEQIDNTVRTAKSYDDYVNEVQRLGDLTNRGVITQKKYNELMEQGARAVKFAENALVLMNEAQFNAINRTSELTGVEKEAAEIASSFDQAMLGLGDSSGTAATAIQEAGDASDKFNERLGRLNDESAEAIKNLRDIQSPLENFLGAIDTRLDSPIKAFIEDLQFMAVGGAQLTQEIPALLDEIAQKVQQGVITPEEAEQLSGQILAGFLQAKEEAGQIDFSDAAKNLSESLQIPITEARAILDEQDPIGEVQRQLNEIDATNARQQALDFTEGLEGVKTSSQEMETGVKGNLNAIESEWAGPIRQAQKYKQVVESIPTSVTTNVNVASGGEEGTTGGGKQHGGAVYPGFSYPVGEAGPELFVPNTAGHIVPGNQVTNNNRSGDLIIQNLNITSTAVDVEGIARDIITVLGEEARLRGMSGASSLGV